MGKMLVSNRSYYAHMIEIGKMWFKEKKVLLAFLAASVLLFATLVGSSPAATADNEPANAPLTESHIELVDAEVENNYVFQDAVPEAVGNAQQLEATENTKVTENAETVLGVGEENVLMARANFESAINVVGITWDVDVPAPTHANYRYLENGTWSPWDDFDIEDSPDGDGAPPVKRVGTEVVTLPNSQSVEVLVRTDSASTSQSVRLVIIDAEGGAPVGNALDNNAEKPQAVNQIPSTEELSFVGDDNVTSYATDTSGLKINTRKAWGANESLMKWKPKAITIQGAVIHHTAGNGTYTKDQVPGQMRAVYGYHAVTLGWGDIGYNLVVDRFGGVWEGRYGGITKGIQAAHAYGANAETFGISILGTYTDFPPTQVAQDSLAKAIAWKLRVHGIRTAHGSIKVPGSDMKGRTIALVSGHRDVGGTSCPGDAFYARIPTIRNTVQKYMNASSDSISWYPPKQIGHGFPTMTVHPGDWSGDGYADLMMIDKEGRLWYYRGLEGDRFAAPKQIGHGWQNMDWVQGGVDWTGDGNMDLIARNKQSGTLHLYTGDGRGGFKSSKKIGHGWNAIENMALANTAQGPGIYGTYRDQFAFYRGDGKGAFRDRQIFGHGWGNTNYLLGVGDWNANGYPDMLMRNKSGDLFLYPGQPNGHPARGIRVGRGWNNMSCIKVADQNAFKSPVWAVHSNGKLFSYRIK